MNFSSPARLLLSLLLPSLAAAPLGATPLAAAPPAPAATAPAATAGAAVIAAQEAEAETSDASPSTGDTLPLTGLPADDPVVAAIYATEDLRVMQHLDELVNGIGPRLTGSENLTEACHWAAEKFRAFGLENVRLEEWGQFPVGFDRRFRTGRMVQPEKRKLVFGTNAWSPGTDGPQRGHVVLAPNEEEGLEAVRDRLAGCWLLATTRARQPRFDSDGDDLRSQLGRACDEAGILGVLTPSRRPELVLTSGRYDIDWDDLPDRVRIKVRADQVAEIVRMTEDGEEVVLEFDVAQGFRPGPVPLYNVIAEIPGSERPEELLIFGGHLDSWDGATGTQDNGTGTCTTLEAARILREALDETGRQPRRTIRFMLWTGEEQGLLGSRAYIRQHPEELDRISAVIVHDGGTNACSGISADPAMLPLFEEAFAPVVERTRDHEDEDLRFRINEREQLRRGIGSDHDSYLRAGVPGFFWQQRGRTSYGFIHHTQNDVYRYAVPEYQRYSTRVIASTAWRLGAMEPMVPREHLPTGRTRAPRRQLGVFLGGDGLAISGVSDGSLAAQAGLREGDVLVRIGKAKLEDTGDIRRALRGGEARKLVVWTRNGRAMAAWFDWEKEETSKAEPGDAAAGDGSEESGPESGAGDGRAEDSGAGDGRAEDS